MEVEGCYEAMNAGNGYFMVNFDLLEDKDKEIIGRP